MSGRTLVIYYSFEGHTRAIAEAIAAQVGADLLALRPRREPPHGFLKYLVGGMQASWGLKPELLPLDKDPRDYDLLFVGTPIWAGRHAPALNSLMARVPLQGKKVALFCSCQGGEEKALQLLSRALAGNEIVSQEIFTEGQDPEPTSRARSWADQVVRLV